MPSPEEKARRKAIKQALRQEERDRFRSTLPVAPEILRALFDHLDRNLEQSECDCTLRHTEIFLAQRKVDPGALVTWLADHHGFCDCEVLFNVEEKFLEAFPEHNS